MTTSRARAIADVNSGTILASVEIAAQPERVFQAITSPAEIVRWWGSDQAYRTTKWDSDLRVNGRWRAEGVGADGVPFSVEGEFIEIDPPHKLVQTWKPEWDGGESSTLCYTLEPTETGTRLIVHHDGFGDRHESCRSHGAGWLDVLSWLTSFVETKAEPAPSSTFLVRLIAPRPTFAMDMNDAERAVMQEHFGYWSQRMNAGQVIAFGPVGDPAGPWGFGLVRARDLADVQAFGAGDPAIKAERGFRYEYLPMINLILPQ
jgi:uncharacterized protein YndB with AHSA1/START domain